MSRAGVLHQQRGSDGGGEVGVGQDAISLRRRGMRVIAAVIWKATYRTASR
jgi:hypothetical protein